MSTWRAKFQTPIDSKRGEFTKGFQTNIKSNFEKRLPVFHKGRIVGVTYSVEGEKETGYRLVATVAYESDEEVDPRLFAHSARWRPILNEEKWHRIWRNKAKKIVGEKMGLDVAEKWYPTEENVE